MINASPPPAIAYQLLHFRLGLEVLRPLGQVVQAVQWPVFHQF